MTPILPALMLLLSPRLSAADPAPAYHHYRLAGKARWEGDVAARADFVLNDTLPSAYEFCMVPPGADWAVESKDPKIEEKYLLLVDRVITSDGIVGGDGDGSGGGWIGACGSVRRFGQIGDHQRMQNFYFEHCKNELKIAAAHKYACEDKKIVSTGYVVVDSLKTLLASDHDATVKRALYAARSMKGADKLFAPIIAKLVLDSSRSEELRLEAAAALGTIAPTELSGKTIAPLWLDEKMKPETRVGAMNVFAFLLHYGDAHGANVSTALKSYLPQLKGINREHFDETKGKADAVGDAAYCAGKAYPKTIQDEAKFK